MIKLTRLDRQEIALNCDRIEWVEACPDTTVRLAGGESILVRESVDEVVARVAAFRSRVLREAALPALLAREPAPDHPSERPRSADGDAETVVVFDRESIAVFEVHP
jgi:flagellar protein FlbD